MKSFFHAATPFALIPFLLWQSKPAADPDSDGDGLSDYQEIHKYFTDPFKADSDGDGKPDGDWNERREFSYTVRSVIRVMPPYNLVAMNDDYQDVRAIAEKKEYLEAEVISYPFNTCHVDIGENANWKKDSSSMKEALAAGITSNWDKGMQTELLREMKKNGIDPEKSTDRALVEKTADWLMRRCQFEDGFTTFAVDFKNGKPKIYPGMEDLFSRELKKNGRTAEAQWERELFGKGMFENKVHGSCTSTAIYLQTCLRALGIPTRTVICIPVLDASDPEEVSWIESKLTHPKVKKILSASTKQLGNSWSSHTFNEVFVGKRWRRLNYERLGQNILDEGFMGLLVHVNTFLEHADAKLSATWGLRNIAGKQDDAFGHSNPYSCIEISDQFGPHCKLSRDGEHHQLTISRAYWFSDPSKPEIVQMKLGEADTAGHLVVHVDEVDRSEGSSQYLNFFEKVPKEFRLVSDQDEIQCAAARGYWVDAWKNVQEFYLYIPPEEFSKMSKNRRYQLVPAVSSGEYFWKTAGEIWIEKP